MNYLVIAPDGTAEAFNEFLDAILFVREKVKSEPGINFRVYSETFNSACFDQTAVRNERTG